jgi:hypothetical protein
VEAWVGRTTVTSVAGLSAGPAGNDEILDLPSAANLPLFCVYKACYKMESEQRGLALRDALFRLLTTVDTVLVRVPGQEIMCGSRQRNSFVIAVCGLGPGAGRDSPSCPRLWCVLGRKDSVLIHVVFGLAFLLLDRSLSVLLREIV